VREREEGEPASKIRLKRLWQLAVQHESWVDELESMETAVNGWECKAYRCRLLLRGCGCVATRIESRLGRRAVKMLPPVSTIIGLAGIATTLSWTLATESSSDWAGELPFLSETGARPPRYFVFLFLPGTAALLTLLVIALAAEGHELALLREPALPHRGGAFTSPYGVIVLAHIGCASALALLLTVAVSTNFFQPLHASSSYVFFASYFTYALGNAVLHHKRRGSRGTWETLALLRSPGRRRCLLFPHRPPVLRGTAVTTFARICPLLSLAAECLIPSLPLQYYTMVHQWAWVVGVRCAFPFVSCAVACMAGVKVSLCGCDRHWRSMPLCGTTSA